ncbi:GDSL-type esterase/lipase family protein [Zafaria sp. Z1313]|uniref:GDSL-type esterase/lipase family protein n=1 Tax=unclassified Zafaria TaxID=2828765 RepID=UPI002E78BD51|nr:GDSL-type esterase/lipase family protein [Zafaria sp. J156]MEE1622194.1 GDSL-type esterase/lipase family protein [Zafaria sp. J156]
MEARTLRIAAVGNELLAGHGDPRALGWYGRVLARTTGENLRVQSYTLAAPGEGTEALAQRWIEEAGRRLSEEHENRLVIGLSDADLDLGLSTARSRLNLANILDAASQMSIKAMVVGPVPGLDAERNARLAELSAAYADVANRRRHAYVDTFTPLQNHEQWRTDLAANDGLPGQAGHGLMAWLVLHRGWYTWLGLPEPSA